MTIVVTGANGFIGSYVLAALERRSIPCVAVDLRPPKEGSARNVRWLSMDLHQPPEEMFYLMGRPDTCIHLAWGGLPNYRSLHHFEKELPSQYDFLSTLVRAGLSSLVVTGTCFEYGMQTGSLTEDMDPRPANPYGFAKDALRRQLQFLREVVPFTFLWARLFYVYGDGQAANSLWPQLRQAVQRGDKTFPMSGGDQLRDYLPIEMVAEHLVSFAVGKSDAGIVNVCSGQPLSVRDLVTGWIVKNGWKIELDLGRYPYPDYEPMEFWGSRDKLQNISKLPCG